MMSYSEVELRIAKERSSQVLKIAHELYVRSSRNGDAWMATITALVSEQVASIDDKSVMRQQNIDLHSIRKP